MSGACDSTTVDDTWRSTTPCRPTTHAGQTQAGPRGSAPRPVPSSLVWGGREGWTSMPTRRNESSEGGMDRRAGNAGRAKEEGD